MDSNLDRNSHHKNYKTVLPSLTGDSVTDFYVRIYLFEFVSGHLKSSLRLLLDIPRPSMKTPG